MNAVIVIIVVCFACVLIHTLFQLDWHRVFFVREPVRPWVITQPVKKKTQDKQEGDLLWLAGVFATVSVILTPFIFIPIVLVIDIFCIISWLLIVQYNRLNQTDRKH
jgi:hypothetical protein